MISLPYQFPQRFILLTVVYVIFLSIAKFFIEHCAVQAEQNKTKQHT